MINLNGEEKAVVLQQIERALAEINTVVQTST
jgi:hypothetical protein